MSRLLCPLLSRLRLRRRSYNCISSRHHLTSHLATLSNGSSRRHEACRTQLLNVCSSQSLLNHHTSDGNDLLSIFQIQRP